MPCQKGKRNATRLKEMSDAHARFGTKVHIQQGRVRSSCLDCGQGWRHPRAGARSAVSVTVQKGHVFCPIQAFLRSLESGSDISPEQARSIAAALGMATGAEPMIGLFDIAGVSANEVRALVAETAEATCDRMLP